MSAMCANLPLFVLILQQCRQQAEFIMQIGRYLHNTLWAEYANDLHNIWAPVLAL